MTIHQLDAGQARKIAVQAQALSADRHADLVGLAAQLTLLQIDPIAAIAPSADLVAWSRLGSTYDPGHLKQAVEIDRTLYEHNALIRPASETSVHQVSDSTTSCYSNAVSAPVRCR